MYGPRAWARTHRNGSVGPRWRPPGSGPVLRPGPRQSRLRHQPVESASAGGADSVAVVPIRGSGRREPARRKRQVVLRQTLDGSKSTWTAGRDELILATGNTRNTRRTIKQCVKIHPRISRRGQTSSFVQMPISMWFPWLVLVLRTAVTFIFLLLPVRGVTVPQCSQEEVEEKPQPLEHISDARVRKLYSLRHARGGLRQESSEISAGPRRSVLAGLVY
ncbi:hypothetical protein MRX96_009776 [Rhipicephalus microplus]